MPLSTAATFSRWFERRRRQGKHRRSLTGSRRSKQQSQEPPCRQSGERLLPGDGAWSAFDPKRTPSGPTRRGLPCPNRGAKIRSEANFRGHFSLNRRPAIYAATAGAATLVVAAAGHTASAPAPPTQLAEVR